MPRDAKTVLVVDDDGSIRSLLSTLLEREGFAVERAENGGMAIAALEEKTFDAVVLDLMMRDGSGQDVLEVLGTKRPHVKCVVVISATSAANIEAIDHASVQAKLRKPFDINDLLDAVRRCVGH